MKSKIFLLRTIVFVISCFLFSCNLNKPFTDTFAEKQLIEKSIRTSIGWAANKDLGLLYSVISSDSSFLEIHPGPVIVRGFSGFRKNEDFWMSPDFKAVRYEIRDLVINISRSGDVAWWFCMLDDINTWKGEPASWVNTRWTGVTEKRNGKWIIVQQHFSFAKE
jgi:ketosteroid isomerase-like protein